MEYLACPRYKFEQSVGDWVADAHFEYNGRYSSFGGDHARCPECNKLLHIDYDLIELDENKQQSTDDN